MTGVFEPTKIENFNVQASNRRYARNGSARYSVGDIVKFELDSGEVQKGNVHYIEGSEDEDIFYINSFSRWAYKVPEKKIISRVSGKKIR